MSNELRLGSEKRLRIFTGRGYPELAEEVASELGVTITPTSAYDFANGEIFIRFEESVRSNMENQWASNRMSQWLQSNL